MRVSIPGHVRGGDDCRGGESQGAGKAAGADFVGGHFSAAEDMRQDFEGGGKGDNAKGCDNCRSRRAREGVQRG